MDLCLKSTTLGRQTITCLVIRGVNVSAGRLLRICPISPLDMVVNPIFGLFRIISHSTVLVKSLRLKLTALHCHPVACQLIRGINEVVMIDVVPILIPRITF